MKFGCAIIAGCVIFIFVIMWAMFGSSLYWQIQNSDLASPYMIRVYTTDGEVIDSVKVMQEE